MSTSTHPAMFSAASPVSGELIFAPVGITHLTDTNADLIRAAARGKQRLRVTTAAQLNGTPHIGTVVTVLTVFALTAHAAEELGLPATVIFDALDNAPAEHIEIHGQTYTRTVGDLIDTGHLDRQQRVSGFERLLTWAAAHCGAGPRMPAHHRHPPGRLRLDRFSGRRHRADPPPLPRLPADGEIRRALTDHRGRRRSVNYYILAPALATLGVPATEWPVSVFTPMVLDRSGGTLSKTLYVRYGKDYADLPEAFLNLDVLLDHHGEDALDAIWTEIQRWVAEPRRLHRSYTVDYVARLLPTTTIPTQARQPAATCAGATA